MSTVHAVLLEDFGVLDPGVIRTELLATAGIHGVEFDSTRKGLSIAYDPDVLPPPKLFLLLCRCGVYPDPQGQNGHASEVDEG